MELLKIPTVSYGTCYLIHCRNIDNWGEEEAVLYIGYVDSLKKEDVPKRLTIYFTGKLFSEAMILRVHIHLFANFSDYF